MNIKSKLKVSDGRQKLMVCILKSELPETSIKEIQQVLEHSPHKYANVDSNRVWIISVPEEKVTTVKNAFAQATKDNPVEVQYEIFDKF